MTDWIAEAHAEIFRTGSRVTTKTDKCNLSTVSAVQLECISASDQHLLSVSSVQGWGTLEKLLLSADLMEAAMSVCDQHSDGAAAREEMRKQCMDLPFDLQLDLFDHFTGTPWRGRSSWPSYSSPSAQPLPAPEKCAPNATRSLACCHEGSTP